MTNDLFGFKIIDNTAKHLEKFRFSAIVISDKYQNGEEIPLGFYCMQELNCIECITKHMYSGVARGEN